MTENNTSDVNAAEKTIGKRESRSIRVKLEEMADTLDVAQQHLAAHLIRCAVVEIDRELRSSAFVGLHRDHPKLHSR